MRPRAEGGLALTGLLALVLAAASAVWACVPQPLLVVEPPASARPGDEVTVRGLNFRGRAEIRLNAIDGPRLATGSGRQFAVDVVVPRVRSGLYVLVAVTREPSGGLSATASAPLEVSSPQPVPGGPRAGGSGASSQSTSGIAPVPAAAGGLGLLALGALVGWLLARGRRRASLR